MQKKPLIIIFHFYELMSTPHYHVQFVVVLPAFGCGLLFANQHKSCQLLSPLAAALYTNFIIIITVLITLSCAHKQQYTLCCC